MKKKIMLLIIGITLMCGGCSVNDVVREGPAAQEAEIDRSEFINSHSVNKQTAMEDLIGEANKAVEAMGDYMSASSRYEAAQVESSMNDVIGKAKAFEAEFPDTDIMSELPSADIDPDSMTWIKAALEQLQPEESGIDFNDYKISNDTTESIENTEIN